MHRSSKNKSMSFNLDEITRQNIKDLVPYSSARDEFSGVANVFLDANENSLGSPLTKWYNRYPDPLQKKLKEKLSKVKAVTEEKIFIGNGSDECIDILFRCFCEPGQDNVIVCPPTYGMYAVSAAINNVAVKNVNLTTNFQLDLAAIEEAIDDHTKMIFLCSPNNPSGNSLIREDVEMILNNYFGLVVIDEAYINFSRHRSFIHELADYPNLVILQTLSKAWGLAALRLGLAFADDKIIGVMNKVKPPYNINQATQDLVLKALDEVQQVNDMIVELVTERESLTEKLLELPVVEKIYPSDANFLLVKVNDADGIYQFLLEKGIVVRNRSKVTHCEGCLRITVGTKSENELLVKTLLNFTKS